MTVRDSHGRPGSLQFNGGKNRPVSKKRDVSCSFSLKEKMREEKTGRQMSEIKFNFLFTESARKTKQNPEELVINNRKKQIEWKSNTFEKGQKMEFKKNERSKVPQMSDILVGKVNPKSVNMKKMNIERMEKRIKNYNPNNKYVNTTSRPNARTAKLVTISL